MKGFDSNTVYNPLTVKPTFIELVGQRVSLPAVMSYEPLLRGCDQKAWLEKLVELGIRHLVVPLNGTEEDSCLYARRHPRWVPSATESAEALHSVHSAPGVIYDLEHRDEGVFARLQFLLSTAESIGVLVGVSLFNLTNTAASGPFRQHGNVQNVTFSDFNRTGKGAQAAREKVEAALLRAVDWVSHEIRGRPAVWLEIFRGVTACDDLTVTYEMPAHGFRPTASLRDLEARMIKRAADTLTRVGENSKNGPWIIVPGDSRLKAAAASHVAPFDLGNDVSAMPQPFEPDLLFEPDADDSSAAAQNPRRPMLFHFTHSPRSAPRKSSRQTDRARMWRGMMHGCWPVVAGGFHDQAAMGRWKDLAEIANFARHWVPLAYLRACPEILASVPEALLATGRLSAATDGSGHYFVYLAAPDDGGLRNAEGGLEGQPAKADESGEAAVVPPEKNEAPAPVLTLRLMPGSYRFFWIDSQTGKGIDYGDSLLGGDHCTVPGLGADREAMLILEQEELPDPLSIW